MSDLVRTQILLDKNQRLELDEIATKEGKSFSEVVRNLIEAQLRQRKYEEMRVVAAQLAADYAEGGKLSDLTAMDGEDFLNA